MTVFEKNIWCNYMDFEILNFFADQYYMVRLHVNSMTNYKFRRQLKILYKICINFEFKMETVATLNKSSVQ